MTQRPSDDSEHTDRHQKDLEDSFFAGTRTRLREKLREALRTRTEQMESLAEVSGITDVELLEKLVILGIRRDTLAALTLYPLVAVAWADGKVDAHEREAVLSAAEACGLERAGVSYALLAEWLRQRPDALLLGAWKRLVARLSRQLDAEWRETFEREILSRARAVANASGGFLALDKTSSVEQVVLSELRSAFE